MFKLCSAMAILAIFLLQPSPDAITIGIESSSIGNGTLNIGAFTTSQSVFVENKGQYVKQLGSYYWCGSESIVFFSHEGLTVIFRDTNLEIGEKSPRMRILFDGGGDIAPTSGAETDQKTNFLNGNNSAKWYTNLRSYRELVYQDLWQGIDLIYSLQGGHLKYTFYVHPGASIESIRLRYEGAIDIGIDARNGELIVKHDFGFSRDKEPNAYQNMSSKYEDVPCEFRILQERTIGFKVGLYDRENELIIDPEMGFFTYLGGNDTDEVGDIEIGSDGSIYVAGATWSQDFPSVNGTSDNRHHGSRDVFITKFDKNGSELIFSTLIGGMYEDVCNDLTIGTDGTLIICGYTNSPDFPTTGGAYCTTQTDAFVMRLDSTGSSILASSFLGVGSGGQKALSVHVIEKDIWVAGVTSSSLYPVTPGAIDSTFNGGIDVFISSFDINCSDLHYSTFIGGESDEWLGDSIVSPSGVLYCTGYTSSSDFLVTDGAFCTTSMGKTDVFILGINGSGGSLIFSSLIGGGEYDRGSGIAIDGGGNLYLTGYTTSSTYPTTSGALDQILGGPSDLFLCVLTRDGSSLVYSSFLGGSGYETDGDIAIQGTDVIIAGQSRSTDFPMVAPSFDGSLDGLSDIILARINLTGDRIVSSTYLGGTGQEWGPMVTAGNSSNVFITGMTTSKDFPTTVEAYDRTYNGGDRDLFVCKLQLGELIGGPPLAPHNVTITTGDRRVLIGWMEPDKDGGYPISAYYVYRGETAADLVLYSVLNANTTFFEDMNLILGKTYFYAVHAVNLIGEGPQGPVLNATAWGQPMAPVRFQASPGDKKVQLGWGRPMDMGDLPLLGYHVFRGEDNDTISFLVELGPDVTGYLDEGLINDHRYYYSISGFNARGEGWPSETVDVMPIGPPDRVSSLAATPGDANINLRWGAPDNDGGKPVTGYVLLRGLSETMLAPIVTFGNIYTYTDTNVVNNVTYYYSIFAMNILGNGTTYPVLTVQPKGRPGSPLGLSARAWDGHIILWWNAPENDGGYPITGYRVYRGINREYLTFIASTGPVNSYVDVDVLKGETRYYVVRAQNSAGEGPPTESIEAMALGLPGNPHDLVAEMVTGSVLLRWNAPSDWGGASSLSYVVYRGHSRDALEPLASATAIQEYIDSKIILGELYFYSVVAENDAGPGPMSEAIYIVTGTLPGAPNNLTAVAFDRSVMLRWFPPDTGLWYPVLGYAIHRGLFETGLIEVARVGPFLSFNDTHLVNGVAYYYSVSSINSLGVGPQSDIVSVIPGRVPGMPTGLTAIQRGSEVLLQWDTPIVGGIHIDGYAIYRGVGEDRFELLTNLSNVTHFVDNSTAYGTKYYYRIVAFNEYGPSVSSSEVSVELNKRNAWMWYATMVSVLAVLLLMVVAIHRYYRKREMG